MYLYFFKKQNKIYYSIVDDEIGKKAIEFILPSKKGLTKIRCKSKHIIDEYVIDSYRDITKNKQELKEKYKFRILLIKSELPESDLYKMQLMILDNIFFDVMLKDVECERRDETTEPQIWEALNKDSAIEGMNLFNLNDDIPDEVKELLYA